MRTRNKTDGINNKINTLNCKSYGFRELEFSN